MPVTIPFIPSLIDPATSKPDLLLSTDCSSINVTDHSNYTTSTENGFDAINVYLHYRKIIITHQSGAIFTMSSLPGGDQLIPTASTGTQVVTYTIGFGDGVYSFQMMNIPTWVTGIQYANTNYNTLGSEIVYNPTDGLLYENIDTTGTNASHQPDLSPTWWRVISEADALNSRFSTTEKISVYCDANSCYMNNVVAANCGITSSGCNDDLLCKNKNFMNAMKLSCLIDGIIWASEKGDFDLAETYFNSIAIICNCN